jgi:hypothetical protein
MLTGDPQRVNKLFALGKTGHGVDNPLFEYNLIKPISSIDLRSIVINTFNMQ